MRRLLTAVLVATVCVGLVSPVAWAETVGLLPATPKSDEAIGYLARQLDPPGVLRTSSRARNLNALILEARREWHDDLVVVVDAERAVVSVVRPADGTIGSRALAASAASAPYALALAAAELLEIVRNAPPARSAALPAVEERPAEPERLAARFSMDLGLVQSVATNGDIGLLEPTAGADFEIFQRQQPWWLALGAHATGLVPSRKDQMLILPDGPDDRATVEYRRTEISGRVSAGHRQGQAAAVAFCDLGVAFVQVAARDGEDRLIASDDHSAFWLGLAGELRYSIGGGVALGVGAGGAWFPVTTRFYASPRSSDTKVLAFSEGAAEFRAQFALHWGAEL